MMKFTKYVVVSVLGAAMFAHADAVKELNDAGSAFMKEKKYAEAGAKFLEAAMAQPKSPKQLANGFDQAMKELDKNKNTDVVAQAEALELQALGIADLASKARIRVQQRRIATLTALGKKNEARALAQDMLGAHLDFVNTASLAADVEQAGTPGRDLRFRFLERILDNPDRYNLEKGEIKTLIEEYYGYRRAWGGDVMVRAKLEKAEAYAKKYGVEVKIRRLEEQREADSFPLSEAELHIPNGLRDFGIDPDRKVVHAKDFGWNPTNVTECLTKAINSDASTVIVDDMGSPWYIRQIKISKETGSNKQIVFKKGVKVHAVTKPNFVKGDMFLLQGASNLVFVAEGELGKDVYIGQFPDRKSRFATGISYGGSAFHGEGYNILLKNIWSANNLDDGFCLCGSHHYLVDCLLDNNFRQGLSVVRSDHGVYKNVTFCRTVGGEPHNGFDLEPVYEVYLCPAHYFLNCRFFDNAAGNVVLSASNYAPTTLYFKDCEFAAGRYRNISVLARLGIYTGPVQHAVSNIIFEDCRIDGYSDAATLLWNTMIFDMTFKNCVFNDKGQLDKSRKPNASPILLELDRGYWDGFYPEAGVVNFENCKFNGWEGKPLIAVADRNGKLGVKTFRGVVDHNGKKVDLGKFSYMPAERNLKNAPDPDLKALGLEELPVEPGKFSFALDYSAPWYHPKPAYKFVGKAGTKEPVAIYAEDQSGVGRRLQLKVEKDAPRACGYFEVMAGKKVNIKLSDGGLEILDEDGKPLIHLDKGEYFGTKVFALNPKANAIWSFRALTPSVKFRFFDPYAGLIAEDPEKLPTVNQNLKFTRVEPVLPKVAKDEAMLPLPAKYAEEVAKIVAERREWAKAKLESGRLADAEKSLAELKKHSDNDATKREIDDVSRTVERLKHHVKGEDLANKESDDEAKMAAMLLKYGTSVIPEFMWACPTEDGILVYPDAITLKADYNEIIRRLEAASTPVSAKPVPVSTDKNHWWWKAHEYRLDQAKKNPGAEIVLLGDSITHYLDQPAKQAVLKKHLGGKTLNLGIEGDETQHLLWRIGEGGELKFCKPKTIAILIGTNNFGKRKEEPSATLAGIKAVVDKVLELQPQAKIVLYKLLPRGNTVDDNDACKRCAELNVLMDSAFASYGDRIVIRDLWKKFLKSDGKTIDRELLEDGLHPAPKGYEVWLEDLASVR